MKILANKEHCMIEDKTLLMINYVAGGSLQSLADVEIIESRLLLIFLNIRNIYISQHNKQ